MNNFYIKEQYYKENYEEYNSPINPTQKEVFFKGFDEGYEEGMNDVLYNLISLTEDKYENEDCEHKYLRLIDCIINYEDNICAHLKEEIK